jgi:Zn-dependent peptidase ImmA (M78 family)
VISLSKHIDDIISELIKRYNTNNPLDIAKKMNINLIEFTLDKELCGYYRYIRRNKYIVINNSLVDSMKLFVIAHELGHAILHPRINTYFLRRYTLFPVGRIENEANEFATKLLIRLYELHEGITKENLLKNCGIPPEMARFI